MTRSSITLAALALLPALSAGAAGLEKHKDWGKSPEFTWLATDAEKKDWKKVKTDEEADKFLALFWAKRDPDLKTPTNEFKARFDALAAKADELFSLGGKRGALTERGKCLLLIGPPKSMAQKVSSAPGSSDQQTPFGGGGGSIRYVFSYEQAQLPAWADVKSLEAKFEVDQSTKVESLIDMAAVRKLEEKAVQMAIANPDLKDVPVYKTREQAEAEARAARDAALELAKGEPLTAPVREILEKAMAGAPAGPLSLQPMVYRDGTTSVMLQVFALASQVTAPETAKLAVLARVKGGPDAARREEPANLQKSKGDFFADRLVPMNPGEYDVAVALLDAAGAPLVTAYRSVRVEPLPAAFGASPLFLAYNDFPPESPRPEDAFTFSSRKFVSRGDAKLNGKTDGISYVVRIYNPTVDPTTKTMTLKRTIKIKPANGSAVEVPLPPDEPQPAPDQKDGQAIVLDLAGNIVENGLEQYFLPGSYELKLKVTDAVSQKSIDLSAPFTIVAEPGSEKPAEKPATKPATKPAEKPAPKKK